jgi:hypothetical protein
MPSREDASSKYVCCVADIVVFGFLVFGFFFKFLSFETW